MKLLILSCALGVFNIGATALHAQPYPSKPIRLVVAYPAGGTTDIIARVLASKLTEVLSQPVVVDNRSGAAGLVGTELVAKAPADGYTLLLGNSVALATGLSLYPRLPFDPVRDFAPISMVAETKIALVLHPAVPASTLKELIALAKSRPGKLNYASGGIGSMHHLLGELMKLSGGVQIVHVPYKGSTPALIDLMGGQVDMKFDNLASSVPFVKAGKLKAIVVASTARSELLPQVPTTAEAGMPELVASPWFGLVAPARTPKDLVMRLHAATVRILRTAEIKDRFTGEGLDPVGSTPEEFALQIRDEGIKWAKVIAEAKVKAE